jgi:hypothetical protein
MHPFLEIFDVQLAERRGNGIACGSPLNETNRQS